MKYYLLADTNYENSTLLDQVSHRRVPFSTGHFLPKDFQDPFIVELDPDFIKGEMATLYLDPAVIATKAFYHDLTKLGIDNIEARQVVIQDNINNKSYDNYLLLNIIGRVSCANMEHSEYRTLGDGMNIINKLVIDSTKTHGLEFFLVHEDTDSIVISERIYTYLNNKEYGDLYFEELQKI